MFNTNLKHLSNYLSEVLEYKKHFNVDDELQKYNIEKREAVLRNILENNPFGFEDLSFELYKKDNDQFLSQLQNLENRYFKEMLLEQINLINDYKSLWSKEIREIEKTKVIKRIVISKNLKKKINDSLDIFNISSGSLFPELSDVAGYIKNRYGVRWGV